MSRAEEGTGFPHLEPSAFPLLGQGDSSQQILNTKASQLKEHLSPGYSHGCDASAQHSDPAGWSLFIGGGLGGGSRMF